MRDFLVSVFPQTTKGDLPGIDTTGIIGRLPATTDGFVLTLDATQTFGFKWAAVSTHTEDHDHDGAPTQKLLAANTHESPSADTHHAQSHAHNGADGSGTVAGSDLTGTPGGELGGTWASPTVDATHSGSAHHTRLHAVTDTSDHSAGNWKVLYTNGSGQVIELALGADGTFLQGNGVSAAPSFAALVAADIPALNATIIVSSAAFMPTTTSGATDTGKVEIAAQQDEYFMDFPDGSTTYAIAEIEMPDGWDLGTLTARFVWTANSTSTNNVVWGIKLANMRDNDALTTAYGTEQTVTDANGSSAYTKRTSAATSAITPGGTAGADTSVRILVYRKGGDGSDTLAATARLMRVKLEYTRTYSD